MSKLYKYKKGIIGDYNEKYDTSFINYYKLVLGVSTYKGGTTDYINFIAINIFNFKPTIAWISKKSNTGYNL